MATDSGTYTPETIARRMEIAKSLLGERKKPVTHWAEGLDELAKGYYGGKMYADAETAQKEGDTRSREFIASLLSGGTPPTATGPQGPAPEAMQAPAQAAQPMGELAGMPRGFRNNNPLNIEAGSFTQGQPGFSGSDGRFAKFASVDQGLGAANKLLDVYQNKHGLNTIAGIINRWAPAADGNNVSAYAANVAKQLGVDPSATVTPEMRPQLIAAMAQHENGRPLPQGAMPQQMAQAGPPQTAGNPMQARIVEALRSNDPFTARAAQGLAGSMLQRQMEGDKPTDEMREYNLYKQQGGNKSFFDYKADLKKAGAQSISIDQRGEAEFDKKAAGHQAERFDKLVSGGMEAKAMRADLDALKDIGSRITTGKTAELTAALGPYAEALGVKIEGLDDLQAYKSIVSKLAPRMRVVGSGATSDYEMRQFLEALPGLGKTPGGNEMIQATLQALQDHKEQAAEIASQAMNKEITPREADKLLRGLPDPLTAWKKNKGKQTLQATPPAPAAVPIEDLLKKYGPK